ncbi:hypothetical protein GCM10022243_10460 [Saccharothrix violaceirubra]|uniref:DUF4394 domain-containing protein n=1 Tax=Saccharothrix violaceirubra TaxID=413306 RepID=A0A7W7T3Y9_9PSEU|nr:DUF4394 domain-containing protein [Saccharothrix violaceirubra]MBB4966114.1 hypothetical protein [Saccharothrix violaceirubra]
MRSRISRFLAVATAVAAAAVAPTTATAEPAPAQAAQAVYGLAGGGKLLSMFRTDSPDRLDWVRTVNGLVGDSFLIGFDFRVQDGKLYGVGNRGGVYTIGIPSATVAKVSQLTVALHGTYFGVDFNPAANRLRVVSDTGQNLRHSIDDNATATDTPLTTPPATGTTTGVTAIAYTNNDLNNDTGTTLFVINTDTDQVAIQSPANSGQLAVTGKLAVRADTDAGFDIFSDLTNGRTTSNLAFAALGNGGISTFYGVDVLTGFAWPVGDFPLNITDIAVALDTA